MYNVIQITDPSEKDAFMEQFNLGTFNESVQTKEEHLTQLYTEAVFAQGKATVMPLVEKVQAFKDLLDEQIKKQDESNGKEKFDPVKYWKNLAFKDFEDEIKKIFGFRNVQVHPYIEKYISSNKSFESKIMNCEVYYHDRFPIEGLVTDKGFYDQSHSLTMEIYVSLGLIKSLTAEEIVAVFLHEFGHSIDPAMVDIKYTEVNILSKYLTDRKKAIKPEEQRFMKKYKYKWMEPVSNLFGTICAKIKKSIDTSKFKLSAAKKDDKKVEKPKKGELGLFDLFGKANPDKNLKKIEQMVKADPDKFTRQNFMEAFADNFARMYGFGAQLMSGLKKLSAEMNRELRGRYKKEKARQKVIVEITESLIKDVHKTDMHRAHALIKEYKNDLNDPNISSEVKAQLKEDLAELEKVVDEYTNNYDDFQSRVNKVIFEELEKMDPTGIVKEEPKEPAKDDKKDEPEKKPEEKEDKKE